MNDPTPIIPDVLRARDEAQKWPMPILCFCRRAGRMLHDPTWTATMTEALLVKADTYDLSGPGLERLVADLT